MYDTREEANQKLASSIILFNDSPVYIQEAVGKGSKISLRYLHLRTREERSNSLEEPGWNYRNLGDHLGYANTDIPVPGLGSYREAMYCTRMAVRQANSTQGISNRNIRMSTMKGSSRLGLPRNNLNFTSIYTSPFFLDMLEKKYPSMKEVEYAFSKDKWVTSRAFNRQFAINKPDVGPFFLEYKGKNIGHSEDFNKWKIASDFKHLNETLEYINLKVA